MARVDVEQGPMDQNAQVRNPLGVPAPLPAHSDARPHPSETARWYPNGGTAALPHNRRDGTRPSTPCGATMDPLLREWCAPPPPPDATFYFPSTTMQEHPASAAAPAAPGSAAAPVHGDDGGADGVGGGGGEEPRLPPSPGFVAAAAPTAPDRAAGDAVRPRRFPPPAR